MQHVYEIYEDSGGSTVTITAKWVQSKNHCTPNQPDSKRKGRGVSSHRSQVSWHAHTKPISADYAVQYLFSDGQQNSPNALYLYSVIESKPYITMLLIVLTVICNPGVSNLYTLQPKPNFW